MKMTSLKDELRIKDLNRRQAQKAFQDACLSLLGNTNAKLTDQPVSKIDGPPRNRNSSLRGSQARDLTPQGSVSFVTMAIISGYLFGRMQEATKKGKEKPSYYSFFSEMAFSFISAILERKSSNDPVDE